MVQKKTIEQIFKQNPKFDKDHNFVSFSSGDDISVHQIFVPPLIREQKAPLQDPQQFLLDCAFEALTGIKPKYELRYFFKEQVSENKKTYEEVYLRKFDNLGEAVKYGTFLKKVKNSYNKNKSKPF